MPNISKKTSEDCPAEATNAGQQPGRQAQRASNQAAFFPNCTSQAHNKKPNHQPPPPPAPGAAGLTS